MFAKKTVDGVLANFRKAVDDLRKINEEKVAEVDSIGVKMLALSVEQAAAAAEAERARKIADNIKLISA